MKVTYGKRMVMLIAFDTRRTDSETVLRSGSGVAGGDGMARAEAGRG